MDKLTVVLVGVLIYLWYFRTEQRLLVTLTVTCDPARLLDIQNVEEILEVERDLEDHMKAGAPTKSKYNYVLITGKQPSEQESLKYGNYLQTLSFIEDFKIYPFESKPYEKLLMNSVIFLKGLYVQYVTGAKMTPMEHINEKYSDFHSDVCNKEALKNSYKTLVVNVMRLTPENDDMQVYIDTVFGQYFPIVQARMAVGGKPVSDYWDQFAVLEYTRANFCAMAFSNEMGALVGYKRRGLEDAITLLTHRAVLKK